MASVCLPGGHWGNISFGGFQAANSFNGVLKGVNLSNEFTCLQGEPLNGWNAALRAPFLVNAES